MTTNRVPPYQKESAVRRFSEHHFYLAAAAVNLLLLLIGFQQFFLHGGGEGGRVIAPRLLVIDIIHGVSITAWYLLLLLQTMLVSLGITRLHRKLGWVSVVLVPIVTTLSVVTALRSVREMPDMVLFEMPYPRFLLVMLAQVGVFLVCATMGILLRKRPSLHRVLMLTASTSLLGGATSRIPWLNNLFGGYVPSGYFGPIFAWCAVLTIFGSLRAGRLDRPLAASLGLIVVSNLTATAYSITDSWAHWISVLMK